MTLKNGWDRRAFLGSAGVIAGMLLNARRMFGLTPVAIPAARPPINSPASVPRGTSMQSSA